MADRSKLTLWEVFLTTLQIILWGSVIIAMYLFATLMITIIIYTIMWGDHPLRVEDCPPCACSAFEERLILLEQHYGEGNGKQESEEKTSAGSTGLRDPTCR